MESEVFQCERSSVIGVTFQINIVISRARYMCLARVLSKGDRSLHLAAGIFIVRNSHYARDQSFGI